MFQSKQPTKFYTASMFVEVWLKYKQMNMEIEEDVRPCLSST